MKPCDVRALTEGLLAGDCSPFALLVGDCSPSALLVGDC
jgi:hypothetical protein